MNPTSPLAPRPPLPRGTAPAPASEGRAPAREAESPSEAPARPGFLDLLTPEEREFFERQSAAGPLTYRPDGKPAELPPVRTGQRIDLKG
jgi:hypothetical protein